MTSLLRPLNQMHLGPSNTGIQYTPVLHRYLAHPARGQPLRHRLRSSASRSCELEPRRIHRHVVPLANAPRSLDAPPPVPPPASCQPYDSSTLVLRSRRVRPRRYVHARMRGRGQPRHQRQNADHGPGQTFMRAPTHHWGRPPPDATSLVRDATARCLFPVSAPARRGGNFYGTHARATRRAVKGRSPGCAPRSRSAARPAAARH